ncbi:MAG TPA: hypothetical protein DDW84_00150 [Phycisphaerales bacterium]|nr:MAG: hypothetical protein A2Y13_02005 [Planctomycetes bacterium GWC2_45_44]HBG77248.1 hypothetical protein [Phycisphaerales bacterium]HBR19195.1 hypothetical protein [Phycisphaerales bacterium]
MSERPVLRRAELLIWPQNESVNASDNVAMKIVSDGTRDHLRMSFAINKSILGTPNNSQILLYNLKKETRDYFSPLLKCSLRVGWDNYGLFEIYNGGLVAATHQRQGADIITKLIMLTGITATSVSVTSATFSRGTKLSYILKTMVEQKLPGVKYDPARVKIADGEITQQGLSFAGSTKDFLDKLAKQYGFSWSIQDGVFQAIQDGKSFGRNILISSDAKTLFNVAPILQSPMQVQTGVTISALLVPGLLPGDTVTVQSSVNPQLDGVYMAHTIAYNGDLFGNEWGMIIQSFKDFSAGTESETPIYEVGTI